MQPTAKIVTVLGGILRYALSRLIFGLVCVGALSQDEIFSCVILERCHFGAV